MVNEIIYNQSHGSDSVSLIFSHQYDQYKCLKDMEWIDRCQIPQAKDVAKLRSCFIENIEKVVFSLPLEIAALKHKILTL